MKVGDFSESMPGRLVRPPEGALAFVPNPLPPPLEPSFQMMTAVVDAQGALSELSGVGHSIPNAHLLIRPFFRKEAEASSRTEGTEADLDELFIHEADPEIAPERRETRLEVMNYVLAMERGVKLLKKLPFSLRLVRGVHKRLMEGVRGRTRTPGEFGRLQNRLGGSSVHDAVYVPPPAPEMDRCLDDWEKFIHEESEVPPNLYVWR